MQLESRDASGIRRFVEEKHLSHDATSVFMLTVYFRE